MSSEEHETGSAASSHHTGSSTDPSGENIPVDHTSDELTAHRAQMDTNSSAPEADTGRGQEASSFRQGSGVDSSSYTRGAWKGSDVK
jgi:hypothetical protein